MPVAEVPRFSRQTLEKAASVVAERNRPVRMAACLWCKDRVEAESIDPSGLCPHCRDLFDQLGVEP